MLKNKKFIIIFLFMIAFLFVVGRSSWVLIDEAESDAISSTYIPLAEDQNIKTYNGKNQTAIIPGILYEDDKCNIEYYQDGAKVAGKEGVKNAGKYEVKVSYQDETNQKIYDKTIFFTINKKPLNLTIANKTITYGEQAPTININEIQNDGLVAGETLETAIPTINEIKWNYEQYGNVGDYHLNEELVSLNYEITTNDPVLTVNKKDVQVTWPTIIDLIYNAQNQMPEDVEVSGLLGDQIDQVIYQLVGTSNQSTWTSEIIDAGKYDLKIELQGEKKINYNLINESSNITIKQKELTINWKEQEQEDYWKGGYYNAKNQMPQKETNVEVLGLLGIDGVDYEILADGNLTEIKNVKTYTIMVFLTGDKKTNYLLPSNTTKPFQIGVLPVKFKEGKIIEIDYNGYNTTTIQEKIKSDNNIEYLYNVTNSASGITKDAIITDEVLLNELKAATTITLNDGKNNVTTLIGNTYKAMITLNSPNFRLDSSQSNFYELLKYKTVDYNGTFYTIEDALNNASSGTITVKYDTSFTSLTSDMIKDRYSSISLYDGESYRTIKNSVTLLLPYDGASGLNITNEGTASSFGKNKKLELFIPENLTLKNEGMLNIGGITTGQNGYAGGTAGDYAQITLDKNAKIESDGDINAYGFILEKEENNNSQVIMNKGTLIMPFIVREHRGGSQFLEMIGGAGAALLGRYDLQTSPFNTFFMENVRSKLIIISGANLLGHANLYAAKDNHTTDISIIGNTTKSLINLSAGSKVIGKFQSNGVTKLEIKGSATIDSMSLTVSASVFTVTLSTSSVHFPISWRYDVLLSPYENGDSAIVNTTAQKLKLLPGSKFTISQGVTLQASEITVYDNKAIDFNDPCQAYERKSENAALIVNGKISADKLAGNVQTTEDGAILQFSNNASNVIITKELTANPDTYKEITMTLNGKVYGGSNQIMPVNTYTSRNGEWLIYQNLSVTYHANGGTFGSSDIITQNLGDCLQGNKTSASNELPQSISRQYYRFLGWSTSPNGPIMDPVYIVSGEDNHLYAIWEPIEYTFKYEILDDIGTTRQGTITTWNAEMNPFELAGHIPSGLSITEGYNLDAWYLNDDYTNMQEVISMDTIANFTDGINQEITLYGRFEKVFSATLKYEIEDFGYNAEYQTDLIQIPNPKEVKAGDQLDNLPNVDSDLYDNATDKKYYFAGWYDKDGNLVSSSTQINSGMLSEDGITIIITAKWFKKVTIKVSHESVEEQGYYKPGSNVDLIQLLGVNPAENDYKLDINEYFDKWILDDSSGRSNIMNDVLYIPSNDVNGIIINVTSSMAEKIKLILTVSAKGKLASSVTASASITSIGESYSESTTFSVKSNSGLFTSTVTDTKTYYLKPGQNYTVVATSGSITSGSPSGTAVVGTDISIEIRNNC